MGSEISDNAYKGCGWNLIKSCNGRDYVCANTYMVTKNDKAKRATHQSNARRMKAGCLFLATPGRIAMFSGENT